MADKNSALALAEMLQKGSHVPPVQLLNPGHCATHTKPELQPGARRKKALGEPEGGGGGRDRPADDRECHMCGETGHIRRDCPQGTAATKKESPSDDDSDDDSSDEEEFKLDATAASSDDDSDDDASSDDEK